MDSIKIGKFIAERRKQLKMTQEQLAMKLGVTYKTVSRWENGNYMPDISLLKPLSEILEVTLNDLMSGECVDEEDYERTLSENLATTIDYTGRIFREKERTMRILAVFLGAIIFLVGILAIEPARKGGVVIPSFGALLVIVGVVHNTKWSRTRRVASGILAYVLFMGVFIFSDYLFVRYAKSIPRFTHSIAWFADTTIFQSPFCNVYVINGGTKNEYKLFDFEKKYDMFTVPKVPFNRDKSGIDNIIRYENEYMGNNSNTGNLIGALPLSEFGYVFEMNSSKRSVDIYYQAVGWYIEELYLKEAMLYDAISMFLLIDNLECITFHFSGEEYMIQRKTVEDNYPNFHEVRKNGSVDKELFDEYIEKKILESEFIKEMFDEIFETI